VRVQIVPDQDDRAATPHVTRLLKDLWRARVGPLLPLGRKPGRPPVWACWRLIDGKWWRTKTGARIFEWLQAEVDAKGLSAWDVSVDSMMSRAISTPTEPGKGGSAKGAP
jgi:hypothetical protein